VNGAALDRVFRAASGRIVGALAARFRDLDLAEDAFSEACARSLRAWSADGAPGDAAAWLYRVAERIALDALRRRRTRERLVLDEPPLEPTAEEVMADDCHVIPDERLRLIFICCHPAVASDARAALTLRLVCGLTVTEVARAFLVAEPALAQRLVRAKRKIADAGVPFELPRPELWPERMEAVLSTLEVAYAKAHEDAAGSGPHAGFAAEVLHLTKLLTELVPSSADAHALAATVRYAEARRPARVDDDGMMIPLSDQDPARWRRDLIAEADGFLGRAGELGAGSPRVLQAALQGAWCVRRCLDDPAPWSRVLGLYDRLLAVRDDPVVRLNRAVALAYVVGEDEAFAEIASLDATRLASFPPFLAVRAELCARSGRTAEARAAYAALLALDPSAAERLWLSRKLRALPG
jgi:RNA polymerase sigma-70 factor (ECF subfamily)